MCRPFLIVISFILFFSSCDKKRIKYNEINVNLKLNKNLLIEDNYITNVSQAKYFYNAEENCLFKTDYSTNVYKYSLKDTFQQEMYSFNEHNLDRIGIVSYNNSNEKFVVPAPFPNRLFLIGKSHLVTEINLKDDSFLLMDSNRKAKPIWINDSTVIIYLNKGNFTKNQKAEVFKNDPLWGIVNINSGQIIDKFGSYPEYFFDGKRMPMEFLTPYFTVRDSFLIAGFPMEENLLRFNIYKEQVETISAPSKYFKKPEFPKNSISREEEFNLFYFSNKFGPLNYHDDLGMFSRILLHELEGENPCNRKYSLLLFDDEMKYIGEHVLKQKDVDWNFSIGTKDGFLCASMCKDYNGDDFLIYNKKFLIEFNDEG